MHGTRAPDIYLDPAGEVSIDPRFAPADAEAIISAAEDLWGLDTGGRVALRLTIGGPGMPIYLWQGDGEHNGVALVGPEPPRIGLIAGADRWTVAHELGHTMGLKGHSPNEESLMGVYGAPDAMTAVDGETLGRFCARWGCPAQ